MDAVQRLADYISGVFVPIVAPRWRSRIWLGAGRGRCDGRVHRRHRGADHPRSLRAGLATPIAMLVGTGRGAQIGILIKGPEVLESSRRGQQDRHSRHRAMALAAAPPPMASWSRLRCRINAALEQASDHPIAAAIARGAAEERTWDLPGVRDFANHRASASRASSMATPCSSAGRRDRVNVVFPAWRRAYACRRPGGQGRGQHDDAENDQNLAEAELRDHPHPGRGGARCDCGAPVALREEPADGAADKCAGHLQGWCPPRARRRSTRPSRR